MHKIVIAPLLAVLGLFQPSNSTSYIQFVDTVSASIVHVTGEAGKCTGEIIAQDRVLTAGHCYQNPIYSDGEIATVIRNDPAVDLMLLKVPTGKRPTLVLQDASVEPYTLLVAFGYAYGIPKLTVFPVLVLFPKFPAPWNRNHTKPGIVVQPSYIGGMSGGPVVNSAGEMVGIIQQGDGHVGYGIGVVLIRAFLYEAE